VLQHVVHQARIAEVLLELAEAGEERGVIDREEPDEEEGAGKGDLAGTACVVASSPLVPEELTVSASRG
jgi:hypothetical protein